MRKRGPIVLGEQWREEAGVKRVHSHEHIKQLLEKLPAITADAPLSDDQQKLLKNVFGKALFKNEKRDRKRLGFLHDFVDLADAAGIPCSLAISSKKDNDSAHESGAIIISAHTVDHNSRYHIAYTVGHELAHRMLDHHDRPTDPATLLLNQFYSKELYGKQPYRRKQMTLSWAEETALKTLGIRCPEYVTSLHDAMKRTAEEGFSFGWQSQILSELSDKYPEATEDFRLQILRMREIEADVVGLSLTKEPLAYRAAIEEIQGRARGLRFWAGVYVHTVPTGIRRAISGRGSESQYSPKDGHMRPLHRNAGHLIHHARTRLLYSLAKRTHGDAALPPKAYDSIKYVRPLMRAVLRIAGKLQQDKTKKERLFKLSRMVAKAPSYTQRLRPLVPQRQPLPKPAPQV